MSDMKSPTIQARIAYVSAGRSLLLICPQEVAVHPDMPVIRQQRARFFALAAVWALALKLEYIVLPWTSCSNAFVPMPRFRINAKEFIMGCHLFQRKCTDGFQHGNTCLAMDSAPLNQIGVLQGFKG